MSKFNEACIPASVLKSGEIQAVINGENLILSDGRIVTEEPSGNLTSGVSLVVHFTPPGMFYSNQYQKFVQKLEDCALQKSDTKDPTTTLKHLVLDGTGFVTDRVAHRLASEEYPEITFLGTASSSPNKYRNISCILMQLELVLTSFFVVSIMN
ncbi:unnamed protein product [Schistosoma curassoni]|uniref:VWFA domain-containing protein n=1 Tax=Schistosoma curassoni TaxID=6186 RepID=A0A183KPE9_9TREM|nr:unnamed protein product [Schistosoma curassoni]